MTPYYEQSGVTIYHGDCREVIEQWEGLRTQSFDLLLTDPPYGINVCRSQRLSVERGRGGEDWDREPIEPSLLRRVRNICREQIVWGGNYYELPPCRGFLIWDKGNAGRDFADCEFAWTSLDAVARSITIRPMNMDGGKVHSTQKPEALMRWCILQALDTPLAAYTILDPFMLVYGRLRGRRRHDGGGGRGD